MFTTQLQSCKEMLTSHVKHVSVLTTKDGLLGWLQEQKQCISNHPLATIYLLEYYAV
jgi:hypothetical protein